MTQDELIVRINILARRQKDGVITVEEKVEQTRLRQIYLDGIRQQIAVNLESIHIREADGSVHPLEKKQFN